MSIRKVEANREPNPGADPVKVTEFDNLPGHGDTVRTEIKEAGAKSHQTRIKDIYRHLNYVHERIDRQEDLMKGVYNKVDRLLEEIKDVKNLSAGKDVDFEKALRSAKEIIPELTKPQSDIFGSIAPEALRNIVESVLGSDFGSYTRADRALPTTFFTLLVPKRLSGMDLDFRSQSISNASPEADVKKWCEKVKSNIYRQFSMTNAGNPRFLTLE